MKVINCPIWDTDPTFQKLIGLHRPPSAIADAHGPPDTSSFDVLLVQAVNLIEQILLSVGGQEPVHGYEISLFIGKRSLFFSS